MPEGLQRGDPVVATSHMWPIKFKSIYNFSSSVAEATSGRWQSLDSCRSRTFPAWQKVPGYLGLGPSLGPCPVGCAAVSLAHTH